jgi:hypothetical protein
MEAIGLKRFFLLERDATPLPTQFPTFMRSFTIKTLAVS